MAGRSPPSMTVTGAAERASRVPRLRFLRRGHPPLPRAEWGTAGKTARAPPPTASIPRTPEKRLPGARVGRGHNPEKEDGGL